SGQCRPSSDYTGTPALPTGSTTQLHRLLGWYLPQLLLSWTSRSGRSQCSACGAPTAS
ncbi:hypothetical protein CSUI_000513, partial [Cystoisospora suis]